MLQLALLGLFIQVIPLTSAYWIFSHPAPFIVTRLDPIIDPREVSSHVHTIVGADSFSSVYDYDTQISEATCTTAPVQVDFSSYWTPQLYFQRASDGMFTAVEMNTVNTYYLMRPGPKNESIKAFPPGLRMLAGSPNRRTYNSSSFEDQAISYVCLGTSTADENKFFSFNCPGGMRAEVFFPSCWDGVNLDSDNHKDHMAYPIQNYNSGDCPDTHPVHLVSLFYEFIYSTQNYDYPDGGDLMWAMGDAVGYGLHGDFINGWNEEYLQTAIDTCPSNMGGVIEDCPHFVPNIDSSAQATCKGLNDIVDEDVGLDEYISSLPGNNLPWYGGNTTKPTKDGYVEEGVLVSPIPPVPTNWTAGDCISDSSSARSLRLYSFTDSDMTWEMCLDFCYSKEVGIAGISNGNACYCDSVYRNSPSVLNSTSCSAYCGGNDYEICGSSTSMSIFTTTDFPVVEETVPDGWSSYGCVADNVASVSGRTIVGYYYGDSKSMTATACIDTCQSKNYLYAGIEYGQECFCGNTLRNGGGLDADNPCYYPCKGNSTQTCGGSNALSVFKNDDYINTTTASGLTIAPAGWTAYGCVVDGSTRNIAGYYFGSSTTMSVTACLAACKTRGYLYGGLEYGQECFCGNSFVTGDTASTGCTMKCSGNSTQICGGSNALSVYVNDNTAVTTTTTATTSTAATTSTSTTAATVSSSSAVASASASAVTVTPATAAPAGWTSYGCISDTTSNRALQGYSTVSSTAMSVTGCLAECETLDYEYAGLEYGQECYCGNSLLNGGALLTTDSCTYTCPGNSSETCGGYDAMSVYSNDALVASSSSTTSSSAASSSATSSSATSSSAAASSTVPMTSSSVTSSATSSIFSSEAASTTSSSTPAATSSTASVSMPSGWASFGCVADSTSNRTLTGYTYTSTTSMTNEECVTTCEAKGYVYAGTEYGQECYCSNSLTNGGTLDANNGCTYPCSGDSSETCGGWYVATVYTSNSVASASASNSVSRRRQGRARTGGRW